MEPIQTVFYPFVKFGDENPEPAVLKTIVDFTKPSQKQSTFLFVPVDITEKIHKDWLEFFRAAKICKNFNSKLRELYKYGYENNFQVYPYPQDVLNFLGTDPNQIKCCIIGQDPYPGFDEEMQKPVANGYSFATYSKKLPLSQASIREVIVKKYGDYSDTEKNQNPFALQGWLDQGVFLMNKTPVVYVSKTIDEKKKSKAKEIWGNMSSMICKHIDSVNKCPFIMFGRDASELAGDVSKSYISVHMSKRSDRSDEFNSDCFDKVTSIQWNRF